MRRYIIGGIVLTGLVFLVAGGMALAANTPASGSGKAPNLVTPQQTKTTARAVTTLTCGRSPIIHS